MLKMSSQRFQGGFGNVNEWLMFSFVAIFICYVNASRRKNVFQC